MSSHPAKPKSPPFGEFSLCHPDTEMLLCSLLPDVSTQVEKLICCQSHSSDLSHDFLAQVMALQRGEGGYRKQLSSLN